MPPEPLAALKARQRMRSEAPQFSSKLEFTQWADQVAGLLAFDEKARYKFEHYVKLAKFKYSTEFSPLDAINEAIGALNQVITTLEHKPSTAEIVSVPNAATTPTDEEPPTAIEEEERTSLLQSPVGYVGITVFAGVLVLFVAYIFKTHFGLQL